MADATFSPLAWELAQTIARHDPGVFARFRDLAVQVFDLLDGDPDREDGGDDELTGDEQDAAYIEWSTMRGSQKGGPNLLAGDEDDEEDDPSGQCDEDGINTGFALAMSSAPGCKIGDPDSEHDGREPDDGY